MDAKAGLLLLALYMAWERRRLLRAPAPREEQVREACRRAGEPPDLGLLRDLTAFWRDFCEGRVAL
jgi:hypothetical protein